MERLFYSHSYTVYVTEVASELGYWLAGWYKKEEEKRYATLI